MVSFRSKVYVPCSVCVSADPSSFWTESTQSDTEGEVSKLSSLIETRICDMSSSPLRHMEPTQERDVIKAPKASEVVASHQTSENAETRTPHPVL